MLKSPKSTKLENWEGFKKWRALQKLSKNETGHEGGRYKRATQCLRLVLGVHKETAVLASMSVKRAERSYYDESDVVL